MFLFSTSDQILLLYSRKLLLLPLNAVHLFSVVNNQLACVLWRFATFLLLQHIKLTKRKLMNGPECMAQISLLQYHAQKKGLLCWKSERGEKLFFGGI